MKTLYTYLLMSTLLIVNFSKAQTPTTEPSLSDQLWNWAQKAYAYVQENPETVDAFKKQFIAGQPNTYTEADKDAIKMKLRQKWAQSGTNKSFEDWVQEKAALAS